MRAVDKGRGHVREKACGIGGLHLHKFQVQGVGGDVLDLRDIARGGVHLDDTCGLQNLKAAALVGGIAGNGDLVALLQLLNVGDVVGIQGQGGQNGVAKDGDVIAQIRDLLFQIRLVLEGVQVDLPVVQRGVGQLVLGKFDQFDLDVVLGQKFVHRVPLLIVGAYHAHGHLGDRAGVAAVAAVGGRCVGLGRAAGAQGQGEGQGQRQSFLLVHVEFLQFYLVFFNVLFSLRSSCRRPAPR